MHWLDSVSPRPPSDRTGISIPADAKGVEPEQVFATLVLPDAYNKKSAWVSLRGHSDVLYQAEVIYPPRN